MVAGVVTPERPFTLRRPARWLVMDFNGGGAEPLYNVLSWTVVNGGFQRVAGAAWLFLKENEMAGADGPGDWMAAQMRAEGLAGHAGFLTTRREHCFVQAEASKLDCHCWAVGTVGLSNALRVGDSVGPLRPRSGTINLMLVCSHPLTSDAAVELIALASEAKAAAVLDSGVASRRSGQPATGTGTDYLAIAWPSPGARQEYAGKHTAIGSAVGRAAYGAVAEGVREWLIEQEASR